MTETGKNIIKLTELFDSLNPAIIQELLAVKMQMNISYAECCRQLIILLNSRELGIEVLLEIKKICNYGGLL